MLTIDFTPQDVDALHHERFHHPHPRVQLKMEAVYLKSQGLAHRDICRLARISENTLRSYLRQYQEGGVERLKRTDWAGTESELGEHRETMEDHFRDHPPRSIAEAAAEIERITGIRRGPTQVRQFLCHRRKEQCAVGDHRGGDEPVVGGAGQQFFAAAGVQEGFTAEEQDVQFLHAGR